MIHTNPEDIEKEEFGEPTEEFSDPDYEIVNNAATLSDSNSAEVIDESQDDGSSSHCSDIDNDITFVDQEENVASYPESHADNEEVYGSYDLSNISAEDLEFFQLSKIALNRGFSQDTLTDILNFLGKSSNSNWKNNAQSHWAAFDRLCVRYGFKEKEECLKKEFSLELFKMSETVTLNYINPRRAIVRLLRSMDWNCFSFRADTEAQSNGNFREIFSGHWARVAEKSVRGEFEKKKGYEHVFLLGLIIMTDSSTINLRKSKKPFYFAIANCDYNYRNNISCMESVCK